MNKTIEVHTLWGWSAAQVMLGGMIVKIAAPVVTDFHSDIYRDFRVIEGLSEPPEIGGSHMFVYVVRNSGTHLFPFSAEDMPSPDDIAATQNIWEVRQTWVIFLTRAIEEYTVTAHLLMEEES